MILHTVFAWTLLVVSPGTAAPGLAQTLRSVAMSYYADAAKIEVQTGRDTTMDYYQRLLDDIYLVDRPVPPEYSPQMWQQIVAAETQLDLSLASQLLTQTYRPLGSIRRLGETFVRSSKDGTMQPVAVYVPSGYVPGTPSPLVVFLHGRLQPESHLLAPQFVESLAEQINAIVIAPYGRGDYDFRGSESDIYDAYDAANKVFTIDQHKRYLVGFSMGGFAVYRIAPMHPDYWSAVMSIAGSLLVSTSSAVTTAMFNTRFYVLTGARDETVPTLYSIATAIFLRDSGVPVTFYSQPDGTHELYSLHPILSQAWNDMERGAVRHPSGLLGDAALPEAVSP